MEDYFGESLRAAYRRASEQLVDASEQLADASSSAYRRASEQLADASAASAAYLSTLSAGTGPSGPSAAKTVVVVDEEEAKRVAKLAEKVRLLLKPALAAPFATCVADFSGLLQSILACREEVAHLVVQFLFEYVDQKPNTKLLLRRQLEHDPDIDVMGLRAAKRAPSDPAKSPAAEVDRYDEPWPVPEDEVGVSYGDLWGCAVHQGEEPGTSEITATYVLGSSGELASTTLDLLDRVLQSVAWLGAESVDDSIERPVPSRLGRAYLSILPNLEEFAMRFTDLQSVDSKAETLPGGPTGATRLTVDVPVDLDLLESYYPRFASAVRHFEVFNVAWRHPESPRVLLTNTFQENRWRLVIVVVDGRLAWWTEDSVAGAALATVAPAEPACWDAEGRVVVDVEIESRVRLLGLSMSAMPFPTVRLRCSVEPGLVHLACISVGGEQTEETADQGESMSLERMYAGLESAAWSMLEGAASMVIDVARLRQLLVERFCLKASLRRRQRDGWLSRWFFRVAVPTSRAAEVFVGCFRSFIVGQVQQMDVLRAVADFAAALSKDAALLTESPSTATTAASGGGPETPPAAEGQEPPQQPSAQVFL